MTIVTTHGRLETEVMPTPKVPTTLRGRAAWYPYYAGYSTDFVPHVLRQAGLRRGAKVLDPWNGSGTTTQIAAEHGFTAIGIDLNPVMVVVARARLLGRDDAPALRRLATQLVGNVAPTASVIPADDLMLWFDTAAAAEVRAIEEQIRKVSPAEPWEGRLVDKEIATACFLWTALFRAVRQIMAPRRGTNPTWVRRPAEHSRISVENGVAVSLFTQEIDAMLAAIESEPLAAKEIADCSILTGSSTALPSVENESISLVVTSPPYCTRIDYAVTTSVELATLGIGSNEALRAVRDKMIGTTTIRAEQPAISASWGSTCLRLLDAIKSHESHASATYYLKTHQQYFNDIFLSLEELDRCLARHGEAVIVVQDSYYKDIHNDVPTIVAEMCSEIGWSLSNRVDFPVTRNLVGINARAKKYVGDRAAVEAVLHFRKR